MENKNERMPNHEVCISNSAISTSEPSLHHKLPSNDVQNSQKLSSKFTHKTVPTLCRNCGSAVHLTKDCFHLKRKASIFQRGLDVSELNKNSIGNLSNQQAQMTKIDYGDSSSSLHSFSQFECINPAHKKTILGEASPKLSLGTLFTEYKSNCASKETELPKYLENLKSTAFFNPKTGFMADNPNENEVVISEFKGDSHKLRSKEYYSALEMQHSFLTGKSKCIVDFSYDEELSKKKTEDSKANNNSEKLASNLSYSANAPHSDFSAKNDPNNDPMSSNKTILKEERKISNLTDEEKELISKLYDVSSTDNFELSSMIDYEIEKLSEDCIPSLSSNVSLTTIYETESQRGKSYGHINVFGSYYDVKSRQWGYKCCKKCDIDAVPCIASSTEGRT